MIKQQTISTILFIVFGTYNGFSEWSKLESDLDSIIEKTSCSMLTFVSSENGWVQGRKEIYRTENGGRNWERISLQGTFSDDGFNTQSIFFTDEFHGWILWNDTLYATIVGGEKWDVIKLSIASLQRISFQTSHKGVACTQSEMFYTNDGGKTWSISVMPDTWNDVAAISDLQFTDSLTGWASAWGPGFEVGTILHTNDGGMSWNVLRRASEYEGVWGTDSMHIIAVGSDGRYRCGIISVTFDGGTSWHDTLVETYLDDVAFLDAKFGVAVTHNGLLLETYDGGKTWEKIEDIGDMGSFNVSVYENVLYILLLNGEIYRFERERTLVTAARHSSVETKYKRTKCRQLITVNKRNGFDQICGMDLSGRKVKITCGKASGVLIGR